MKIYPAIIIGLAGLTAFAAGPTEKSEIERGSTTTAVGAPSTPPEPPIVLPKVEITARRDWGHVSWKLNGPLPFYKVRRAWYTEVQSDGPLARAGIKIGDELISMNGTAVTTFTGFSFKKALYREIGPGGEEKFVVRTPGEAERTVVVRLKKEPN